MLADIFELNRKLAERAPYGQAVTARIEAANLLDWVYGSLRFDGSRLSRDSVRKILAGDYWEPDGSLGEHQLIACFRTAVKAAWDMADMAVDMDLRHLEQIYALLTGGAAAYRTNNAVLPALSHRPPPPHAIREQLSLMFQAAFQLDVSKDPVRAATFFHNRVLEIQPFAIQSGGAARMLMQYELIRGGLPPVALSFSPEEYDRAVIAYLRKDDETPFYSGLLRSLYNKLTLLDRLTKKDSA